MTEAYHLYAGERRIMLTNSDMNDHPPKARNASDLLFYFYLMT